jgi:hypothetical protein
MLVSSRQAVVLCAAEDRGRTREQCRQNTWALLGNFGREKEKAWGTWPSKEGHRDAAWRGWGWAGLKSHCSEMGNSC